jgi:DMSO/TMAO reductase YedYZ molybdopterin-dependent catalytic subunit
MREACRLPPNQALTLKWPVLHLGSVPGLDSKTWDFRITGLVYGDPFKEQRYSV